MTEARDALAAALHLSYGYDRSPWSECAIPDRHLTQAERILAALPDGWVLARRQDAEDGAEMDALYRDPRVNSVDLWRTKRADATTDLHVTAYDIKGRAMCGGSAPTIAAAARKAREALP